MTKLRDHVLEFDVTTHSAFSAEIKKAAADDVITIAEANAIIDKFNALGGDALEDALDDAKDFARALLLFRPRVSTGESCGAELLEDGQTGGACVQKTDKMIDRAKYIANELAYCVWAKERHFFGGSGQPPVPFK